MVEGGTGGARAVRSGELPSMEGLVVVEGVAMKAAPPMEWPSEARDPLETGSRRDPLEMGSRWDVLETVGWDGVGGEG